MLRACFRALRPGGRLAFFSIFTAPGLGAAAYQRALHSGPGYISTGDRAHADLLTAAGFVDVTETDLTAAFLRTARAWFEGREKYRDDLITAEGEEAYTERQNDSSAQIAALEEGLLRRSLFVASRP